VCLLNECRRKQMRRPDYFSAWIDLRAVYQKFYTRRPKGLEGALQDVGISFEGRQHSGLCDARNTAKLAAKMVTDGCVMIITSNRTGLSANIKNAMPADVVPAVGTSN
jgi:ERI1 exoribonuclease 2